MSAHTKGPTLEQLHDQWLRRNRMRGWPGTFQEAMESPLWSRLLKIRALRVELQQITKTSPVMKPHQANPAPSGHPLPLQASKPGFWMDTDKDDLDA